MDSVTVIRDYRTGRSRRFAFVDVSSQEDVRTAIEAQIAHSIVNGLFPWKQDFPQIIDFIEDFLDSQHYDLYNFLIGAGWSSPVARWAHNPKVVGSNPTPATKAILLKINNLYN